jgi:hypothetical protein
MLCLGLAASAAPLPAATINGTVRSSANAVLQGMVAAAYDASGNLVASATTDANGRYAISISAGQYRLLAYDPNGAWATAFCAGAESFETSPVQTVGASSSITVDFQLQRGGNVSGTVRVAGAARSGVTVAAYNLSGTRRTFKTTGAQGAYSILLPPGQFKFAAYDDAGLLTPLFYPGKRSFVDAAIITVASLGNKGADFDLDYAAHLTGSVVDRASGSGLQAMTVYAYTPDGGSFTSGPTDSGGSFNLTVPAGSYRLVAADPRALFATAYFNDAPSFAKSAIITVAAGQTGANITMAMDRAGLVLGEVKDVAGVPISGIDVAAYNDDGSTRTDHMTDSAGNYVLVLPPGHFRLAAFDNRLVFATEFYGQHSDFTSAPPVQIAAGQIAPGFDFVLERAGRLDGMVTDAVTGGALANITVAAYDSGIHLIASAVSGTAGQYTVAVPPGTYRVVAWDAAHVFASSFDGGASSLEAAIPRTIASDTSQSANFAMSRGIPITGSIVTVQQAPIGGIEIEALDLQGNHIASAISGDDGAFIITVLPNSYKLFAHDPIQRYRSCYYNGAYSLPDAAVVVVSSTSPSPVSIAMAPALKRRAIAH